MIPGAERPKLGIALGGGGARGWAHIGILKALSEVGLEPEVVCGTSIGALVGGIYAAGKLPELEQWVASLTRREVLRLVDFSLGSGGAVAGRRLMELYRQQLGDISIEELPRRFVAVATALETGAEVWLQNGSLLDAIRASISIPGMFTPVYRDGHWLVDGGLVNPVPAGVCRVLGAEVVIAVDLQAGGRTPLTTERLSAAVLRERPRDSGRLSLGLKRSAPEDKTEAPTPPAPGVAAVLSTSLDIVQARLSRSRLAGDPPDLLLTPRVRQVPPLEFAGGRGTIDEGYDVMRRMLPALHDLLGTAAEPTDP